MGTEIKMTPFAIRVRAALQDGYVPLWILEQRVFPEDKYPKAHRNAVQGGPPGCRWVLVAALNRWGVPISRMNAQCNANQLIGPWPGDSVPVHVVDRP